MTKDVEASLNNNEKKRDLQFNVGTILHRNVFPLKMGNFILSRTLSSRFKNYCAWHNLRATEKE